MFRGRPRCGAVASIFLCAVRFPSAPTQAADKGDSPHVRARPEPSTAADESAALGRSVRRTVIRHHTARRWHVPKPCARAARHACNHAGRRRWQLHQNREWLFRLARRVARFRARVAHVRAAVLSVSPGRVVSRCTRTRRACAQLSELRPAASGTKTWMVQKQDRAHFLEPCVGGRISIGTVHGCGILHQLLASHR